MRERFETPEDRERQTQLAKEVARALGWAMRPLVESNSHYTLDYFATALGSRRGVAWVEVKRRFHEFGKYPTIMVSAGKWREGVSLAQTTGLDFWLIFRFDNGVWSFRYAGGEVPSSAPAPTDFGPLGKVWCEWGGRTLNDRDGADAEPVMHLPLKLWSPLELKPATSDYPDEHPF